MPDTTLTSAEPVMTDELTLPTDAELDEMERLAKAATPGWRLHGHDIMVQGSVDTYDGPVLGTIISVEPCAQIDFEGRTWSCSGNRDNNSEFVFASNPATILRLITAARAGLAGAGDMRERAAELADSEAALRKENGVAAEAGDTRWGLDTEAASLAQYHKSVTASLLADAIRALPLTGVDKP